MIPIGFRPGRMIYSPGKELKSVTLCLETTDPALLVYLILAGLAGTNQPLLSCLLQGTLHTVPPSRASMRADMLSSHPYHCFEVETLR